MRADRPVPRIAALASVVVMLAAAGCADRRPISGSPEPSASPVPVGSEAASWTRRAPGPEALTEVAAAAHGGRIWVAGGLSRDGRAVDRVSIFDPGADTWVAGPVLPQSIHHSSLVSDGDALWLIGGYIGDGFGRPTDAVLRLDGDAWTADRPLPEARAAGAAAWDGAGRIVYAGGVGPGGVSAVVFEQIDHGWQEVARLFAPREHLAAASDGAGMVFVLGGRRGGLAGNVSTAEIVVGDEVRRTSDLPTPRGGVAGFYWPALGACLVGGESLGGTNRQVECVDDEGRVTTLPDLHAPRHGLGAAVVDGVVYVLLGGPEPGLFVSDTVEALELP